MIVKTLAAILFAASPALAQSAPGFSAGNVVVRLAGAAVLPLDSSSKVALIGGSVHATDSLSPEVDLSYFLTDRWALQLIAASTRHEISVTNSALGPKLDLGSTWVLPPTLSLQYHFFPHAPLSPYAGAGLTMAFFYNNAPNTPPVDKLRLSNAAGVSFEAGLDYNVFGPWFINIDVKQILLHTAAAVYALGTVVHANDQLNPTVASIGIEYRF